MAASKRPKDESKGRVMKSWASESGNPSDETLTIPSSKGRRTTRVLKLRAMFRVTGSMASMGRAMVRMSQVPPESIRHGAEASTLWFLSIFLAEDDKVAGEFFKKKK